MSLSACLCSLRRGHGLIPGITDLFAFGANLQISHTHTHRNIRANIHTHAGRHMYALHDMHTVHKLVQCVRTRVGNRLMRTSSSHSSATCLRLMKTSMCQCCPGVAKTKHTMYNQADKRCILSPPTQTPIPNCQSTEGTHTRGIDERRKKPFLNDTSHSPDFQK